MNGYPSEEISYHPKTTCSIPEIWMLRFPSRNDSQSQCIHTYTTINSRVSPFLFVEFCSWELSPAQIIIHPRSNTVLSEKGEWNLRDRHVLKRLDDGVHNWRRKSGDYQQLKVENTFYRYKTILGNNLQSRREDNRHVETVIACNILNRFLEMGSCKSELVL